MNEELKDILAGAGIKASDEPKWEPPSHINDLVEAAERSINAISSEDKDITVIVLVGKRVEGGMHSVMTTGGTVQNAARLLRLSVETIYTESLKTLTQDADEN